MSEQSESERIARLESLLRTCRWEFQQLCDVAVEEEPDVDNEYVFHLRDDVIARIDALLGPAKPKTPMELYEEFAEKMQELVDLQAEHIAVLKILRPRAGD